MVFSIIIFICITPFLFGQQLTTIGIIDVQRVYDSFTSGNSLSVGVESIREQYQTEIDALNDAIASLKEERRSTSFTDTARIKEIDTQIAALNASINTLDRDRNTAIRNQRQALIPANFVPQLQRAIVFVAESAGYTVVLSAEAEALYWWSPVVDISDQVIERLIVQITQ